MTPEQITELARQAGLDREDPDEYCRVEYWTATKEELQALANLVRNAALEDAATTCMGIALKPSNVILGVAVDCATAIRSLK